MSVANEIERALKKVTASDIRSRCEEGSVNAHSLKESAAAIMTEVLAPYYDAAEIAMQSGDDAKALALTEGIIDALYRCLDNCCFADPSLNMVCTYEENADWAARLWRSAGDRKSASKRQFVAGRSISSSFIEQNAPRWSWLLDKE